MLPDNSKIISLGGSYRGGGNPSQKVVQIEWLVCFFLLDSLFFIVWLLRKFYSNEKIFSKMFFIWFLIMYWSFLLVLVLIRFFFLYGWGFVLFILGFAMFYLFGWLWFSTLWFWFPKLFWVYKLVLLGRLCLILRTTLDLEWNIFVLELKWWDSLSFITILLSLFILLL